MNKLSDRKITRQFLEHFQNLDSSHDHGALQADENGVVSKEELYNHFDLDNNGVVTPQEYADHIEYHCAYPETLDHYKKCRQDSYNSVPCINSYDSCSKHLLQNPDDIDVYLKPLMDATGSTCRQSSVKSLLDVLQSLVNCGIFG